VKVKRKILLYFLQRFTFLSRFATLVGMKDLTLTVSSKGQITIPKATRQRLGLRAGDRLQLIDERRGVVLKKQKSFKDYIGEFSDVLPQDAVAAVRELRDRE